MGSPYEQRRVSLSRTRRPLWGCPARPSSGEILLHLGRTKRIRWTIPAQEERQPAKRRYRNVQEMVRRTSRLALPFRGREDEVLPRDRPHNEPGTWLSLAVGGIAMLTTSQVGNWFINARRRQPNKSSRESSSIDMKDEG